MYSFPCGRTDDADCVASSSSPPGGCGGVSVFPSLFDRPPLQRLNLRARERDSRPFISLRVNSLNSERLTEKERERERETERAEGELRKKDASKTEREKESEAEAGERKIGKGEGEGRYEWSISLRDIMPLSSLSPLSSVHWWPSYPPISPHSLLFACHLSCRLF